MAGIARAIAGVYGVGTAMRNRLFDRQFLRTVSAALPVISVGNLTVGGSGKSPFTDFVCSSLVELGYKPVVLLRGYGGKERGPLQVKEVDSPARVGDEALAHLQVLGAGAPVVISRSRTAGAEWIVENSLGNVIVLDDGFQHRYLCRDLNILLIPADPLEFEKDYSALFPAGKLREKFSEGLRRADLVVLISRGEVSGADKVSDAIRKIAAVPQLRAELYPTGFEDAFSGESFALDAFNKLEGRLITAIANPRQFEKMVSNAGVRVKNTFAFRDHHRFSEEEWSRIRGADNAPLFSTLKDAVKLRCFLSRKGELLVLRLGCRFLDQESASLFSNLLCEKAAPTP